MTAACPHCGAPIEFRFDDSFVRVCDSCHSAILRTDRELSSLGKLADLAPIESQLRLFAEGRDRAASFLLVGMAQLRHAQGGLWQEWYAKLDDGWGWLSEAQGRFYMTYEAADVEAPAFLALGAGATVSIAHAGVWRDYTVGELGSAAYASARGEIPYRLEPGAHFRFADLAAADGSFLTIDYGDPADADAKPTVYAGRQLAFAELQLTGGEVAPPTEAKIGATAITCPNCSGALELRAPGQSLRVACPYCGTLVSLESGAPAALGQRADVPEPDLKLGTKGTFAEGEMQIIGYLRRSAHLDDQWFPFDEYLLYAPAVGFRWLVQSDGHWSYVQPIAEGAVEMDKVGQKYDGVKFRTFQTSELRVDAVLGEMYWRVAAGDRVHADDYIAPPAMLSREVTGNEESWSLAAYVTQAELRTALALPDLVLPPAIGVAPNQPPRSQAAVHAMSYGIVVMLALGVVFAVTSRNALKFTAAVPIPKAPTAAVLPAPTPAGSDAEVQPAAYFSPPIQLAGGQNIELDLDAALDNDWAYTAVDLVEDKTGTVISVDADLEHYSGVDDGESWSEGDSSSSQILGPVPAGTYVVRVEGQHGGVGSPVVRVAVRQDVFRPLYLLLALLVLLVPYAIVGAVVHSFETKRWSNSTVEESDKPKTGMGVVFWALGGLFTALWALISMFGSSD